MINYFLSLYVLEKGIDNEVVYKMANVMSECGGLEAMLKRLGKNSLN